MTTTTAATDRGTLAALLVIGTAVAIVIIAMMNSVAVSPMSVVHQRTATQDPPQDGGP